MARAPTRLSGLLALAAVAHPLSAQPAHPTPVGVAWAALVALAPRVDVVAVRAGLADGSLETGVCAIDGLFLGEGSACD